DINKLLKMHRQMADMMKKFGKGKGGLAKMFGIGGGEPDMAAMAEQAGLDPNNLPKGLPPMPGGGLAGGLPGLGGGVPPGLPGLPGLPRGKKK
ncbi:MAG: signal recognition particle protein, partial [Alphaproteobacteria bacterium]